MARILLERVKQLFPDFSLRALNFIFALSNVQHILLLGIVFKLRTIILETVQIIATATTIKSVAVNHIILTMPKNPLTIFVLELILLRNQGQLIQPL